MEKFWITAIILFAIVLFIFWKVTIDDYKKEYSEKMWKVWGTRTFYWQGAVIISGGITFFILVLLKWGNIMTF